MLENRIHQQFTLLFLHTGTLYRHEIFVTDSVRATLQHRTEKLKNLYIVQVDIVPHDHIYLLNYFRSFPSKDIINYFCVIVTDNMVYKMSNFTTAHKKSTHAFIYRNLQKHVVWVRNFK